MYENRPAGQIISDHMAQEIDLIDDIIEYRRAMEPDIMRRVHKTAQDAKNKPLYIFQDFYVVLITTIDRVLKQPKIIPVARRSCPTPVYKQSVWKYHWASDELEFLWSIPDAILYYHILNNISHYLQDRECADLSKFVMLMEQGELLEWVKKENGEKKDAVIKISSEDNTCLMK